MDELKGGVATGKLIIRGTIDKPDVVADLNCQNIIYKDFSLKAINFHSEMESDSNFPSGFVNLKIDGGKWRNENFDSGTLDISFSKNRMIVENCHFKAGNDYLLISGSWLSKNKYKIDRIQSAYQNNYLVNAKPIFVDICPNSQNFRSTEILKKISPKTKAIICVHLNGISCDIKGLKQIRSKYKIPIIEDTPRIININ